MPFLKLPLRCDQFCSVILINLGNLGIFYGKLSIKLRNPVVEVGSESVDLRGVGLVTLGTVIFVLASELVCLVGVGNSLFTELLNILLLPLTMLLVQIVYRSNVLLVLLKSLLVLPVDRVLQALDF